MKQNRQKSRSGETYQYVVLEKEVCVQEGWYTGRVHFSNPFEDIRVVYSNQWNSLLRQYNLVFSPAMYMIFSQQGMK